MDVQNLLERNIVSDDETVVIALHEPSWDAKLKRGTASTFEKSMRKSCSRTAILSIEQILELFRKEIGGGKIKIEGYGTIEVATIRALGDAAESKVEFVVTEDPTDTNPAHAEILAFEPGRQALRRRISKGLSKRLCEELNVVHLE